MREVRSSYPTANAQKVPTKSLTLCTIHQFKFVNVHVQCFHVKGHRGIEHNHKSSAVRRCSSRALRVIIVTFTQSETGIHQSPLTWNEQQKLLTDLLFYNNYIWQPKCSTYTERRRHGDVDEVLHRGVSPRHVTVRLFGFERARSLVSSGFDGHASHVSQ